MTKSYLCSKISVKNDSLLFSPEEDDSKETENCRECDYELCRGAQPEQSLLTISIHKNKTRYQIFP